MPAQSASVPAPLGGWNDRDPLADMDALDAVRLVNIFPNTNTCDLRGGYRVHSTGLGGAVQAMYEFSGPTGTRKLIAAANNKLWDATTLSAAATDITNSATITSNKWSGVNFRSRLILVNGIDQPLQVNSSAVVTSAAYTGISDDNKLVQVSVYKSRLYFTELDTASIWYSNVNEITGVLTEYAVGGQLQRGGFVQFTASFTRDLGQGTEDLFVIVSNMGEILIFSGDYPGGLNWIQQGRYFMPVPLGRRASMRFGADLVIITERGLMSLTEILGARNPKGITDKIRNSFRQVAKLYKSNYGWQCIDYPRGNYLAVNIPTADSSSAEQYVMNAETGAWCKFTGMRAICWSRLNEKLYFGASDGKVYEADYGNSDNGTAIPIDIKGAFSYVGDKFRNKRFTMARPITIASGSMSFSFNVDVDYNDRTLSTTVTTDPGLGAVWDTASWDVDSWASDTNYSSRWYSVSGIGRCVAPRIRGSFMNVNFSLSSIDYIFEQGGLL